MSTVTRSPTMPNQSTSPTQTLTSAESIAISVLSPSLSLSRTNTSTTMPESSPLQAAATQLNESDAAPDSVIDIEAIASQALSMNDDDDTDSEAASDSSTSTETPGTISTPRSALHDSGQVTSDPATIQLDAAPVIPDVSPSADLEIREIQTISSPVPTNTTQDVTNSIPPTQNIPPPDNTPEWVKYEEDTSTPDEIELKEIEEEDDEINAANWHEIEHEVFTDPKDPEYRPRKKLRLSWIVKGVRGTRDKPNRARVMSSPSVYVDGNYWSVKFFPRGSKNRDHLAVFVRCSPTPPEAPDPDLEGSFKCYVAEPGDEFSGAELIVDRVLSPSAKEEHEEEPQEDCKTDQMTDAVIENATTDQESDSQTQELVQEQGRSPALPQHHAPRRRSRRFTDGDNSLSEDDYIAVPQPRSKDSENFRLSAQLGLVVYNPDEPRTCYISEAEHQFCPSQDDWGWQTAVSDWQEIHRRKRGQRQALLRNDTLAIDLYICIYDDSTQALFWHESPGESQWDSKTLTGLFPMGTKHLYHSPAVAGITAFAMLVPFRQLIQGLDAGAWRCDSSLRPRPLIAHLQLMLFQMRHMRRDELFVHLDDIIHEITKTGEQFEDVKSFWEVFRRALEIELSGDEAAIASLHGIFGDFHHVLPLLPVKDMGNIQKSVDTAFSKAGYRGALPNFLPLLLNRQSFDHSKREWQLHHDRLQLLDELDMEKHCTESSTKYTLYGFVCHDGERSSNKFFSVLRPAGLGTKWLVFSDGNGNRIFSYTRKKLEEYEGLAECELKSFTGVRQTAYMAIYIRSSCVETYLADKLEPYRLPVWLKNFLTERVYDNPDLYAEDNIAADDKRNKMVKIELWSDQSIIGHEGKIDISTMKTRPEARTPQYLQQLKAHVDTRVSALKAKLATVLDIDVKSFKLWVINYSRLGAASKAYMDEKIRDKDVIGRWKTASNALSLWLTPARGAEIDEKLKQNFCKLAEGCADAFGPPVVEDSLDSIVLEGTLNMFEEGIARSDATVAVSNSDIAEATVEALQANAEPSQGIIDPLRDATGDGRPVVFVSETSPMVGGFNDSMNATEDAAPDAEQASIREAVEGTVANTNAPEGTRTGAGAESTGSPGTESQMQPDMATERMTSAVVAASSAEDSQVTDESAAPVSEPHYIDNNVTIVERDSTTESAHDVVEARAADGDNSDWNTSLPTTTVIPLGENQVIVVQSSLNLGDGISAEDAALISSMIAADLQAQQGQVNHDVSASSELASAVPVTTRPHSHSATPTPEIHSIYGFIQHFDAEKQTLVTMSTFIVDRETTISNLVRSRLSALYPEEKAFQLWRREGTFRTALLDHDVSFSRANMANCCEVIVGDELSSASITKLKAEAKFTDPGQFMRHQALVKRGHPFVSTTTAKSIEMTDFGGDYYFGPVLNGQRHGPSCKLITANGDSYEGPLVSGRKCGEKGQMTYQNGDVYTGGWVDDQKEGQGEFIEKRTGNRYVGGFENDKRWGKGVTYWEVADQQAAQCQVCYFEEVDALFYRCGHVVACYACAKQCSICPICRKSIDAVVKMYRS